MSFSTYPAPSGRWTGSPARFLHVTRPMALPCLLVGLAVLAAGLIWGLGFAPADWQQGETVRIMYLHVPMAWLASAGYVLLAACGLLSLVWRHPLAGIVALEAGPLGATAAALCLITGSLWGKPGWGTWWVWDARLTSMLVLFFLYLGHILTIRAFDDPVRGQRAAALLALAGVVDLPIIKFSVQWWNTLHQPDSITLTGAPTMAMSMFWPLLVCTAGFTLTGTALLLIRCRAALLERRTQALALRDISP
ncbi:MULTISPECIES: heme ABC transporter permease CcmC [Acetobacteraceae]|uniref:Heme exporter protein C n=2 Tax=Acetobacteraceae TaxID=433 RepID=A0ABX4ZNY2_9PROT|nr:MULTISPECIES: heme ABC transporter permease CcmC [Acetobacteraceae]MUH02313.1 heme ABC transporter permease [Bombella sp. ESL0387]MBE1722819.1 cytochrome c biogenesis protein CcsA [Bombella apis]MBR9730624.1 cytochrome c biogenesis protein CcsA [Bombella apis]MCL1512921.1 heme ABC transporter permease [Parasaccharibacter sp. TMW 2.1891]POS64375.1 heme ABC transporter permease [Parasaccharibacter apium]